MGSFHFIYFSASAEALANETLFFPQEGEALAHGEKILIGNPDFTRVEVAIAGIKLATIERRKASANDN